MTAIEKPASHGVQLTSTHEMSAPVSIPPAGFNEKIAHFIEIFKGVVPALCSTQGAAFRAGTMGEKLSQ